MKVRHISCYFGGRKIKEVKSMQRSGNALRNRNDNVTLCEEAMLE
jgi:hypothetical protein